MLKTYNHEWDGFEQCRHVLCDNGEWCDAEEAGVAIESARREWPPGSLQWAIASGRPYRLPTWSHGSYATQIVDRHDGLYFANEWGETIAFVDTEHITATDYELAPEGIGDA